MTIKTPGVADLMVKDLLKPVEERYVHSIMSTEHGGVLIFTFFSYLLALIHKALTIQVDTTFKRTAGDINEWEIVIWYRELQRGVIHSISGLFLNLYTILAVTIGRVYSNRSDRAQYKAIFDELQRLTHMLTGKKLRLKRLSKEGTLLSIGVDLELAQVLGAGDSFLPTNEPEFSGITTKEPGEIVKYFVRACRAHVKRYESQFYHCIYNNIHSASGGSTI